MDKHTHPFQTAFWHREGHWQLFGNLGYETADEAYAVIQRKATQLRNDDYPVIDLVVMTTEKANHVFVRRIHDENCNAFTYPSR